MGTVTNYIIQLSRPACAVFASGNDDKTMKMTEVTDVTWASESSLRFLFPKVTLSVRFPSLRETETPRSFSE